MAANSDLPPAYDTLNDSPAQLTIEPAVISAIPNKCDNGAEVAEPLVASYFEDKKIRIKFIQKVLGITLLQLLAVAALMLMFVTNSDKWSSLSYVNHVNILVVSALSYLAILGCLTCCQEARWKTPYKYIFLSVYQLSFGFVVSIALFKGALEPVFVAWIYYCMVILALMLYSILAYLSTNKDFTVKTGLLITTGVLVGAYALTVPFIRVNGFAILYCTMVVFLLCSYILKDLEAMVSKDYRFVVTPTDYVMGALIIHIDYGYIISKCCNIICS